MENKAPVRLSGLWRAVGAVGRREVILAAILQKLFARGAHNIGLVLTHHPVYIVFD